MLAVDERGDLVDGDQIVAILALHLGVDLVAVTQMTNHGFHALMQERGIRVLTTDVGDRYVLEALWREDGLLGGEQSGHVIYLRDHVSGDGLAAALLLCAALRGRTLSAAAAVMPRWAQYQRNVRVASKDLTQPIRTAVESLNAELDGSGRVLVRASGTEPLIRVLAEAENGDVAEKACASLAALVEKVSDLGVLLQRDAQVFPEPAQEAVHVLPIAKLLQDPRVHAQLLHPRTLTTNVSNIYGRGDGPDG